MANFFTDNADLQFYMDQGIRWDELLDVVEPHLGQDPEAPASKEACLEIYKDIINTVGAFVADNIAPVVAALDKQGLRFEKGQVIEPEAFQRIFAAINDMGLHRMCLPRSMEGLQCPVLLSFLQTEIIARADVSIMTHHNFHGAIGLALLLYACNDSRTEYNSYGYPCKTPFDIPIEEIANGEAWGCMDITEPNAGSDMAAITTKAEQDQAGHWFLTGQKIFITSGHAKYHFVIARSDSTPGLPGLSMFLVPTTGIQFGKDPHGQVKIDRIEEKLGHHLSATCSITFDKAPALLLGKRGDGFGQMLLLMNNARLAVGFEGIGVCEAALRLAKDYGEQRLSMGKPITQHELIADYLDEMETDICGLRALAIHGAFHEEITYHLRMVRSPQEAQDELASKRKQQRIRRSAQIAREVTPLVKYLAAERAVEFSRRCIQIHGGVGYTKEYGAEKLLRDALVAPIYEGTSQIQALMAMKDRLGRIIKKPQQFLRELAEHRWRALSSTGLERRCAKLDCMVDTALQHLLTKTAGEKFNAVKEEPLQNWMNALRQGWDPKRDFAHARLHAERLTRMLADQAICQVLRQQVQQFPQRRPILERYLERAEPRCAGLLQEITTTGDRLLQKLHDAETEQQASAS